VSLLGSFEVAAPDVVDEDFGTEVVVLNLADGRYFSLRGVAATLWRDLREGHAPATLMVDVAKVDEAMAASVGQFVTSLLDAGLVRPCSAREPSAGSQAASVAELTRDRVAPVIEGFDDMAELILSDPIHDVEEDIGWPVRRDAD
jgi:hypothetical protein